MNPDHQLLTGTSPECGVDFRLWVYANVVADGPREMFPHEVPTPPSVHLRDGWGA